MNGQQFNNALRTMRWLPFYGWQRVVRRPATGQARPLHLIFAVADHFEPSIIPDAPPSTFAPLDEQERRVERWCREYPKSLGAWRDADGFPFRHNYFYPDEQY